jgi:hypothetical protein
MATIAAVNACAAVSLVLQLDAILVFHGQRLSRWWLALAPLALTPALGRLAGKSARRPDLSSALAFISASGGADQGLAQVFPPGSRPRRLAF